MEFWWSTIIGPAALLCFAGVGYFWFRHRAHALDKRFGDPGSRLTR
jgi:hypothetical protein